VRPGTGFRSRLQQLYDAAMHNRPDEVIEHLQQLVPEYHPTRPATATAVRSGIYPDDF
jgi:hypothetical protein